MCASVILSTECVRSINEFEEDDYESLAAKPLEIRGYYSYTLPCGGIITSVEARGFCGRPDNVELRLFSAKRRVDTGFTSVNGIALVSTQCNKTATVDDHYEGYVSNNSLNFRVRPGHTLSVFLNPECGNLKCYFQPAIVNKTSRYNVAFADGHFVWSDTNNISLFFSANITGVINSLVKSYQSLWVSTHTELPDETNEQTTGFSYYVVIGILCVLLLCATIVIIVFSIMRGISKSRMKTLDTQINVSDNGTPFRINVSEYITSMCHVLYY